VTTSESAIQSLEMMISAGEALFVQTACLDKLQQMIAIIPGIE